MPVTTYFWSALKCSGSWTDDPVLFCSVLFHSVKNSILYEPAFFTVRVLISLVLQKLQLK